jgi:hypothetical protein
LISLFFSFVNLICTFAAHMELLQKNSLVAGALQSIKALNGKADEEETRISKIRRRRSNMDSATY